MFIQYGLKPYSLGLREEHTQVHKTIDFVEFLEISNEQIAAANKCFVCSDIRVPHVVDGV
jgi:hypothetical protein